MCCFWWWFAAWSKRAKTPPIANRVEVKVIGHQWWWEYVYTDAAGQSIRTANELHVPCGEPGDPRPVALELDSADVIHSFWVPRLAGKTDLIPGRTNRMWFATDAPATYYGQCAEFCGMQHANMKLLVIAEPRDQISSDWLANRAERRGRRPGSRRRARALSVAGLRQLPHDSRHCGARRRRART